MQISLSSPELTFFSHNLKIQDGGGRHLGFIFRLCEFGYSENLLQIYVIVTEINALMLLTFI